MNPEVQHHYRRFRQHQMDTYGDSGIWQGGRSLRQFTGGGAAYGEHAISAFNAARSHVHFLHDLKKTEESNRRRARNARRRRQRR